MYIMYVCVFAIVILGHYSASIYNRNNRLLDCFAATDNTIDIGHVFWVMIHTQAYVSFTDIYLGQTVYIYGDQLFTV